MTAYEQIVEEFNEIVRERHKKIRALIKKAIENGVHVDLIMGVSRQRGWQIFEELGFPEGTTDFAHVFVDRQESLPEGHLRIYHHMLFE